MKFIKNNKFIIVYTIFILLFSGYYLWNTFLDTKVYQVVQNTTTTTDTSTKETEKNKKNDTSTNTTTKTEITSNSYKDSNIEITIKEYYENNTKIYVADILLEDSNYLKTAFAKSSYGKNVIDYTSNIAKEVNAILTINGDYYGVQETGYVLKNGVVYRSTASDREDLVIYQDGSFAIIKEKNISIQDLVKNGAYNILSFGPSLIKNNNISVSLNEEVGKAMASNPRTAIGIIDENHYVFIVSDGRTKESEGLSLYELAVFMKTLGCETAYNLDGGGSSTMYFNGTIINNPTTSGTIKERKVSDIVYIGY